MSVLDKLFEMLNLMKESRNISDEAKELARDNGYVVIIGGSDDLMYAYGAESWLTKYCEHSYGWGGDALVDIGDKLLEGEASQLGLEIFRYGRIMNWRTKELVKEDPTYSRDFGTFTYKVKEGIEFKHFLVASYDDPSEMYCQGIIIKLPDDFVISIDK